MFVDDETEKNNLRHAETRDGHLSEKKRTKRKTKLGCACVSSAFLYVEGTGGFSVE